MFCVNDCRAGFGKDCDKDCQWKIYIEKGYRVPDDAKDIYLNLFNWDEGSSGQDNSLAAQVTRKSNYISCLTSCRIDNPGFNNNCKDQCKWKIYTSQGYDVPDSISLLTEEEALLNWDSTNSLFSSADANSRESDYIFCVNNCKAGLGKNCVNNCKRKIYWNNGINVPQDVDNLYSDSLFSVQNMTSDSGFVRSNNGSFEISFDPWKMRNTTINRLKHKFHELKEQHKNLQKTLSFKHIGDALNNFTAALENEMKRRQALQEMESTRMAHFIRQEAQTLFSEDVKNQWRLSLVGSQSSCSKDCAAQCFADNTDAQLSRVIDDCVVSKCGCKEMDIGNSNMVSLAALETKIVPYEEFKGEADKIRKQKEEQLQGTLGDCGSDCAAECMGTEGQEFKVTEACFEQRCGC